MEGSPRRRRLRRLWNCVEMRGRFCGKAQLRVRRFRRRWGEGEELANDSYTAKAGAMLPHSIQETVERSCQVCDLARWGTGDFAEDGGLFCSGGGGQIRGALVEGFVGEDGKGQGFFGVRRDSEIGGVENRDGR